MSRYVLVSMCVHIEVTWEITIPMLRENTNLAITFDSDGTIRFLVVGFIPSPA